jgi:hypothetical protein
MICGVEMVLGIEEDTEYLVRIFAWWCHNGDNSRSLMLPYSALDVVDK